MSLRTEVVTLQSNAGNDVTVIPHVNDPAEFISDLPIPITRGGRKWEVNLESLLFRTVFGNVQHLEEHGPHMIAWSCSDFTRSPSCSNYDCRHPETFASRSDVDSAYGIRECRLNEYQRYGDMGVLARRLTGLIDWNDGGILGNEAAAVAAADDASSRKKKIEFSVASGGELRIEGDGEVVLLLSRALSNWIGMTDRHGPMVHFGRRHNPYFRMLDFSRGLLANNVRPWVQGNARDPLGASRVEPSRIHAMVSFNGDYWQETCMRIVPWKETVVSDAPNHYYSTEFDAKAYVRVPMNEDVRQVKIRLADQRGRTLRLVSNLEHPTVATLTFRPLVTDMPKTHETTIHESPKNDHTHYFLPPLDNSGGTWQVGLRNIFIPSSIDWVADDDPNYVIRMRVAGEERATFLRPPPGKAFRSPRLLIASLGEILKEQACGRAELRTERGGRVRLVLKEGVTLKMWRKFAAVLGFDNVDFSDDKVVIDRTTTGSRRVDVSLVYPGAIKIGCSAVRPTMFGNTMESVLGVAPLSNRCGGAAGGFIYYLARKPAYADMTIGHISNYHLTLTTMHGNRPIMFREDDPCKEDLFAQISFKDGNRKRKR